MKALVKSEVGKIAKHSCERFTHQYQEPLAEAGLMVVPNDEAGQQTLRLSISLTMAQAAKELGITEDMIGKYFIELGLMEFIHIPSRKRPQWKATDKGERTGYVFNKRYPKADGTLGNIHYPMILPEGMHNLRIKFNKEG